MVVLGESYFSCSQRVSLPLSQNLLPAIFIDLSQKIMCENVSMAVKLQEVEDSVMHSSLRESWLFNSDTELVPRKQKILFSYYLKECLIS